MAIPVTISKVPLVLDTLPALVVRYSGFSGPQKIIYTQARFYVLNNALSLYLLSFEREPHEKSAVTFVLGNGVDFYLSLCLRPAPYGAQLHLAKQADFCVPASSASVLQSAPAASYFSGEDEQGWYWGAGLTIPPALLQQAGCPLAAGSTFKAALFKHTLGREGFASSVSCRQGMPLAFADLPLFDVVSY